MENFKHFADRVVILMLDGVRPRDFFGGVDKTLLAGADRSPDSGKIFANFWNKRSAEGLIYGRPGKKEQIWLANSVAYSLPAYRSIFAGFIQYCFSNYCGRVSRETFPERIRREFELKPWQVATIASWNKIKFAVESKKGKTFVNSGLALFPEFDHRHKKINERQLFNRPDAWRNARYDRHTFAHALNYLKKRKPIFLFISLNDADEWAHLNRYNEYLGTLRQYDLWLEELIQTIDGMPGKTFLFVTTDHGRGRGGDWIGHGYRFDAIPIWLYIRGPGIILSDDLHTREGRFLFSHLDIRPTVERLFGLEPVTGFGAGLILKSVFRAEAVR